MIDSIPPEVGWPLAIVLTVIAFWLTDADRRARRRENAARRAARRAGVTFYSFDCRGGVHGGCPWCSCTCHAHNHTDGSTR